MVRLWARVRVLCSSSTYMPLIPDLYLNLLDFVYFYLKRNAYGHATFWYSFSFTGVHRAE